MDTEVRTSMTVRGASVAANKAAKGQGRKKASKTKGKARKNKYAQRPNTVRAITVGYISIYRKYGSIY
jgi:hypothetical protein